MRAWTSVVRRAATVGGGIAAGLVLIALPSSPASGEPGFSGPVAMAFAAGSNHTMGVQYEGVTCGAVGSCAAVGVASTPGGATLLESDRAVGGAWRPPVALHYPPGANPSWFSDDLQAVSCTSPGNCVAVGTFAEQPDDHVEPFTVVETAGTWASGVAFTQQPSGLPAGQFEAPSLDQVWCASPGNCVVLGIFTTAAGQDRSFADVETSGTFAPGIELQAPSNLADGGSVGANLALACSATSHCLVVGTYTSSLSRDQGVYTVSETAGVWGAPVSFVPQGSSETVVEGAGCAAVSTCIAGGYRESARLVASPYVVAFRQGRWQQSLQLAMPRLTPVMRGGTIQAVGCASTTRCVAVGFMLGGTRNGEPTGRVPASYTWSNGAWSSANLLVDAPSGVSPAFDAVLDTVACPAASWCDTLGLAFPTDADDAPLVPFATSIDPVETVRQPGPPVGVVTRVVGTSVVATWSPPRSDGGSPVLDYQVVRSSAAAPPASCSTTGRRCVLHGLLRGHRYVLSITDRTSAGRTSAPARRVVTP